MHVRISQITRVTMHGGTLVVYIPARFASFTKIGEHTIFYIVESGKDVLVYKPERPRKRILAVVKIRIVSTAESKNGTRRYYALPIPKRVASRIGVSLGDICIIEYRRGAVYVRFLK